MIFHPKPAHTLWPAESLIEGSTTVVPNNREAVVVQHLEHDDGSREVVLRNTANGLHFRFPGGLLVPLTKAPPTWHP